MIKNKFGRIILCPKCFSKDLHLHEDEELLSKMADSEYSEIIVCRRCGNYFSVEFLKEAN